MSDETLAKPPTDKQILEIRRCAKRLRWGYTQPATRADANRLIHRMWKALGDERRALRKARKNLWKRPAAKGK